MEDHEDTDLKTCHLDRKSIFIAEKLFKHCISPNGGKRLRETGSISPGTSLKHGGARKAFSWCNFVPKETRFFTLASIRMAIKRLLVTQQLQPPCVAGLSFEIWLENQAKCILHLCQRSRKNCSAQFRFASYNQKRLMDFQDTMPMPVEAGWD